MLCYLAHRRPSPSSPGELCSQNPVPPGALWVGVEGGAGAPGEPWEKGSEGEVCFSIWRVDRSGEEGVEANMGGVLEATRGG